MPQQSKIGSHATKVSTDASGTTSVKYHDTVVVKFDAHTIELDTGGFKTFTTKTRMNQTSVQESLGYHVYQDRGEWYITYKGLTRPFPQRSISLRR